LSNLPTQKESLSRFRKYLRIDAALFVASMVGAFTLSGFAHLEKFYLTIDVPVDRINITTQHFLAYGAAGFGSYLGALVFAMAGVGIVTLVLLMLEMPWKEGKEPPVLPRWVIRKRDQAIENYPAYAFVGVICATAFFLMLAWFLLVRVPSDAGRDAALRLASECSVRRLAYTNLDQYEGCQVAESNDMIYLLQRHHCDKTGVDFRTLELPKQGLRSITGETEMYPFKKPADHGCREP
jgi:hypothetical protein